MRPLLVSISTFAVLIGGGALGLGPYARSHHLPEQQMARAVAAGDGCFLFLGDSRMVAALDAPMLHRELARAGSDRCFAELALGATDVSGMVLTARQYLAQGRHPRAAVAGKVGDSLLGPVSGLRPEEMVGNNALHLAWSRPGDVFAEVSGFPARDIGAFDAGFRFLMARATALGRYQSLASIEVQRLVNALVGAGESPRNRFGALGDMAFLEDALRARAPDRLAAVMRSDGPDRYGPWFGRLTDLLRGYGVPLTVVELPMHAIYRRTVTDTPQAAAYAAWLEHEVLAGGGSYLDLSRAPWLKDALFADGLHIGSEGASRVSRDLGKHLATVFPGGSQ